MGFVDSLMSLVKAGEPPTDPRDCFSYYELSSVPSGTPLWSGHFLDKFHSGFSLVYDFSKMRIVLVADVCV